MYFNTYLIFSLLSRRQASEAPAVFVLLVSSRASGRNA